MPLRLVLATVSLLVAAACGSGAALAQTYLVERPAAIHGGTCGGLGEVVQPLANLVISVGDPQGQEGATPVEQSGTVVPFKVDDLLATDHAVIVQKSPQESGEIVACGEIGGVLNPDGTLAVGMRGVNGSGLSGVAYFTPIDTFQNTLVTILLVGETPTGSGSEEEADVAEGAEVAPAAVEAEAVPQ